MRLRYLLILMLFAFAACDDDSGGGGPDLTDYTQRFLDDSLGAEAMPNSPADTEAGVFLYDNDPVTQLLSDLNSGNLLKQKANKQEFREVEVREKGIIGPVQVDPGTYEYDVEHVDGPWLFVDPGNPSGSALFHFGLEDGLKMDIGVLVDVPVEVEVEYWYEIVDFGETLIDWNTTVEVRVAPEGEPMTIVYREYDHIHGEQGPGGYEFSLEVGDPSANAHGATAQTSWIGPVLLSMAFWESETAGPLSTTFVEGFELRIYDPALDFVLGQGQAYTFIESLPAKGGGSNDYADVWIAFGTTTRPTSPPWRLEACLDFTVEPGVYDGSAIYKGRTVGSIFGDTSQVACEGCDPPTTCENVWVSWNNDPENPILICELMEALDSF